MILLNLLEMSYKPTSKGGTDARILKKREKSPREKKSIIETMEPENTSSFQRLGEGLVLSANESLNPLLRKPMKMNEVRQHFKKEQVVDRRLMILLTCLGAGNAAEAVEVLSLGYLLNGLNGQWRAVVSSGVYGGMLVGGIFSGFASDASGDRRKSFVRALILATVGAAFGALSVSPAMLFLCRVVAGIGVGAATPPLFALAAEASPPRRRGACITYVAAWWMVGSIFAASTA